MIVSKVAALFGLIIAPAPSRDEIRRELRHARAAAFQHRQLNANAQTDSLDRIENIISDPHANHIAQASERLIKASKVDIERNKDALRDMLKKTVDRTR